MIRRRAFITLASGAAAAWPHASRAQKPAMPVVGALIPTSPEAYTEPLRAFRQGLKDTGYVEGENMAIEYRSAEGLNDQLPALALELARRQVAVIASPVGTPSTLAAKASSVPRWLSFRPGMKVDIDHGGGLVTRYAHASKLLVKTGDLVKRGQTVAQVGTSGRSTGPHLHFEVLVDGVPQNPARFLAGRAGDGRAQYAGGRSR